MSPTVFIFDNSNMARKKVLKSLSETWHEYTKIVTHSFGVLQCFQKHHFQHQYHIFIIPIGIQPEIQSKFFALGAIYSLKNLIKTESLTQELSTYGLL